MNRQAWYGLAFVSPGILYFAVFFVYPVISALSWSFTSYDLVNPPKFIGLDNFRYMASDPHFINSLVVTLQYVGGVVPAVFVVGFLLALLFNQEFTGRAFFRGVFFAPFVVSLVAASLIWRYVYQPTYGLWPQLAGLLHLPQINWLNDARYAIWGLVIIAVWRVSGYYMLIFLAGLQSVPDELHDAAMVDGAGPVSRFRHVTLPLLKASIMVALIFRTITALQTFDIPFTMTRGGPGTSTATLAMYIHQNTVDFLDLGYGSALAVVMFALSMCITAVYLRMIRAKG